MKENDEKFNDPLRILFSDEEYSSEGYAFERKWECFTLYAKNVQEGDFLIMNNNKLFRVDFVDIQFISDEVMEKYLNISLNDFKYGISNEKLKMSPNKPLDSEIKYNFRDKEYGNINGFTLDDIKFDEKFLVIRSN